MSPITTHILDTHRGCPAKDVPIELRRQTPTGFEVIASGRTNDDGRIVGLLEKSAFTKGIYQMFFDTKAYHDSLNITGFYPYVEVTFEVSNPEQHHHIPLLLSPFGYSTYRGS